MKLVNVHLNFSQNLKVQGQQIRKVGRLKSMNLKSDTGDFFLKANLILWPYPPPAFYT